MIDSQQSPYCQDNQAVNHNNLMSNKRKWDDCIIKKRSKLYETKIKIKTVKSKN